MARRFYKWEEPKREDFRTEQEYEDALYAWEVAEMDWEDEYIESRRNRED